MKAPSLTAPIYFPFLPPSVPLPFLYLSPTPHLLNLLPLYTYFHTHSFLSLFKKEKRLFPYSLPATFSSRQLCHPFPSRLFSKHSKRFHSKYHFPSFLFLPSENILCSMEKSRIPGSSSAIIRSLPFTHPKCLGYTNKNGAME